MICIDMLTNKQNIKSTKQAFTIVELLVVIVVLSILAVLTIVSYSGLSSKARQAALQSDLSSNSKKLKAYQAQYGTYPIALDANNCPTTPVADTNYCLKSSSNNSLANYTATATTFSLQAANNSVTYQITESSAPAPVAQAFVPLYSWDFTTQGNTGWTTGIYNSCSGAATIAWASTYYNMWSGDDGSRACYSSSSVNKSVTLTSSEKLVVYIDAEISSTAFNGLALGNSGPGLAAETRYYPNLTRKAIRLGVSANTVSSTTVGIEAISFWANSGTIKTQGRIYFYGIYVAKQSEESQLVSFLAAKGLSVY